MKKLTMRKITETEMSKLRDFRRWKFHGFAYPAEIDEVRNRLSLSDMNFRTEKVIREGKFIGYKIFVR